MNKATESSRASPPKKVSLTYKFAAKDILNRPYTRKLTPEPSGGFVGTIYEFPGCIADGATAGETYEKLDRAALSWLEAAQESGYPVPDPVNYEGHSGKIALRISRRLHKQAAERADLEGVSLNQLVSVALANYLGQMQGMTECVRSLKTELSAMVSDLVQLHEVANLASAQGHQITLSGPVFDTSSWASAGQVDKRSTIGLMWASHGR